MFEKSFLNRKLFWIFKIAIEVVETVSDQEQDKWGPINSEQVNNCFSDVYLN